MKKIFLIEDEQSLRDILTMRLEEAGFEVETAIDGAEALEKLKTITPDIILLDIILPKINGFEVLGKIKEDLATKDIPVIVLSNLGQDMDIKRMLDMGVKDYLVKAQHSVLEIIELIKKIIAG